MISPETSSTVARDSAYRFVIAAIIIGVAVVGGFTFMGVPPLFPAIMDEFGVDRATVSLLASGVLLALLLMRLPGGVLAARIGLRRAYALGALLFSGGGLSFLASNFWFLLGSRIVFGVGAAVAQTAALGLIMQWFRGRELPIVNGLFMVAMSVGNTLTLFLTVPLAGVLGWRGTLTLYGLGVFVLALAWLVLGRERRDPVAGGSSDVPSLAELWEAARHRLAILLALMVIGPMSLWNAYNAWLPTYYYQTFGWPLAYASSVAALLNLAGIPATLVGGILASRMTSRGPIFVVPGVVVIFAALGSFLIDSPTLVIISVLILGVCLWGYWPALLTVPMEARGVTPQLLPVIFGGMYTIANAGTVIAPFSVGFLTDVTGSYLPGLLLWALASATLFFGSLALSRELRKG